MEHNKDVRHGSVHHGQDSRTPAQQANDISRKVRSHALKAKHTGHKIWQDFSKWERVITAGALLGLLSGVLPWASAFGESLWGWQAFLESYLIIPAQFLIVLLLLYFSQGATRRVRILRTRWIMILSSFWLGAMVFMYLVSDALMDLASFFGSGPSFSFGAFALAVSVPMMLVGSMKLQKTLLME